MGDSVVLSAQHRLRTTGDFALAVRRGRRAGGRFVVVHALRSEANEPARVGFVVSKAVGSAVTRNLVKRRLRYAAKSLLDRVPPGSTLVVRALPASATASFLEMSTELDALLLKVAA